MELQRSKAAVLTQVCLWLGGSVVKNPPANASRFDLGREDQLEKEMATHFSILAWEISWTEEPGRLQSMGSERVRDNYAHMHTYKCSIDSKFCWDKLWGDLYGRFW